MTTVDLTAFRNAMASFASGVTVVTTVDEDGTLWGFTASAFSSLSLDPPLILVCLEKRADSHPAFERADHFAVSILAEHQQDTAMRFATRGIDKFGGIETLQGDATGHPLVPEAMAHIECRIVERLPGGDHTILIGEVLTARTDDRPPLLHYNRRFGAFHPHEET
ncbi:MAG: flavin reductase family protein [Dehalococcoidia bacterium]